MRRIGLAVVLTVSLILAPLTVEGESTKITRIGIFSTGNPRSAGIFQAFEQRLRELGYAEGQNLIIEFRNAEGRTDRLPGLAAEMVSLNVDVVVVMVSVNYDPVELGYISSLARPATNITG